MEQQNAAKPNVMIRIATFIVDKRSLIFLLVGIAIVFSLFSKNWVSVENDLTAYLPAGSATKEGLDLMEQQFITYGSAKIMVANVSYEEAEALFDKIKAVEGVQSVDFDRTTEHYSKASALFSITFDYKETDDACLDALASVKALLAPYDTYVSTTLGDTSAELIAQEVNMITAFVAVIVVVVLAFTSLTYADVPIIGLTFIVAAAMNMGTNFLMGTISFVSDSVTTILQLALSLDYAVIYSNRFKEERQTHELREAVIISLSKAIPEVGASSLTTIGGLIAMMFMQFKLGPDMAVNLIKAILFSLLSVFTVMPGLLMLMGNLMEKTRHKNFVPKVPFVGRFAYATRAVIPPIFVLAVVFAISLSNNCPYVYGYDTLVTPRLNEMQIADKMISETFSSRAMVALVVPSGDYSEEQSLIRDLEDYTEVDSVTAIANSDAIGGYKLADKLSPREFAELMKLDYETAEFVYAAYAVKNEKYDKLVSGIAKYRIPLIDMLLYISDKVDEGYITLEGDQADTLSDAKALMLMGKQQLEGEDYDRMLVYLTLPEAGEETYRFTDTLRSVAQEHYPKGRVYVVGNSTNQYEFQKSFQIDNIVVSVVSILIVLVVLLFTFKSAGMPVLLILVIQGSVWMNFSYPTLVHKDVFFLTQLVVSSIQMGANIDYAIVIASRYSENVKTMDRKEAIIEAMNFAFPTILTSGTILAVSGILISFLTTECTINGIGEALGRGTIISIILVMFVLPQILVLGGKILEKTSFSMPNVSREQRSSGLVAVDGLIAGEIRGTVNGVFRGTIDGDVNVRLLSGRAGPPAGTPPVTPADAPAPPERDADSAGAPEAPAAPEADKGEEAPHE
ncbi:MAG: MMPL family transporter [Eubacteriales bacterium]|nr:MMPL family transporter [Eubacteriales bacterium]